MTRTPMKSKAVRIPDSLWSAAKAKADTQGDVLSEVIREALERYIAKKDKTHD